nr:solute carrier family 23 protein [endosymbiont 'TC1' of Trimyema compressum]
MGIKLPVVMGVSFVTVGPMIGIGNKFGITAIFGSVIVAGIFSFLVAPFLSKLVRFFPNIVNGSIVTVVGLSLIPTAMRNAAGGVTNPEFGAMKYLLISILVILIILIVNRFFWVYSNLSCYYWSCFRNYCSYSSRYV